MRFDLPGGEGLFGLEGGLIERISQHLLDLLQADNRLFEGGNAYPTGWAGVTREEFAVPPVANKVNLFDKPFAPDSGEHRPAVYVGSRAMEASDSLDFVTISSGNRLEYRVLIVPLIVCVQADTEFSARKQRNQLRRNVRAILFDHLRADGYWYQLTMPGRLGGGMTDERVWTTATAGGSVQVAEGMGTVPCEIQYSWNSGCDG